MSSVIEKLVNDALALNESQRSLQDIARSLESIASSLDRIASVVAPSIPEVTAEALKDTEVSFSRDYEQARVEEFRETIYNKLGREPNEQEILDFLDGKAVGL